MNTPLRSLAAAALGWAVLSCRGTAPVAARPDAPARAVARPSAGPAAPAPSPTAAAPRVVQPGAPGEAPRVLAPGAGVGADVGHSAADVRFMQGMIPHHAQALAMTALVPERTTREDIRLLARRIELSQLDEIELMQQWLAARGESVPAPMTEHMHHLSGGERDFMPGMLTAEQMASLAAARGTEFDRLFVDFMIAHHEGALIMVNELLRTPGAALGDEIHQIASHVEADQSIEIRRMRALRVVRGP